jgi:hypothetical protein
MRQFQQQCDPKVQQMTERERPEHQSTGFCSWQLFQRLGIFLVARELRITSYTR